MRRSLGPCARSGVTMIELLVVLAILGVLGGVVGLAVRNAAPVVPNSLEGAQALVSAARREAIHEGRTVTLTVRLRSERSKRVTTHEVVALPDGSVIADSTLAIARLSGTVANAGGVAPEAVR